MGRKYRNLYDLVCAFENLWLASRKARRGKRRRPDVNAFETRIEENLLDIQAELYGDAYRFGGYRTFTVREPQTRVISAAPYRDRVVHHALANIIEPIIDRAMIYDSYACRPGKGTHRALDRAQAFLRAEPWVLKVDIRKYFFTIDHAVLMADLRRKISDGRVMTPIGRILATHTSGPEYYFPLADDIPLDACRGRGLPIGNLTSQIFANYYLDPLDRFIKEELKVRHYLRYMDDMLMFGVSKERLCEVRAAMEEFLARRRLLVHPAKTQVFPVKNGVRFLGFHLWADHRRIPRSNLKRFKRRMRAHGRRLTAGDTGLDRVLLSLNAWLGYAGRDSPGTRRLVNRILGHIPLREPGRNAEFTFTV